MCICYQVRHNHLNLAQLMEDSLNPLASSLVSKWIQEPVENVCRGENLKGNWTNLLSVAFTFTFTDQFFQLVQEVSKS